MNSQLPPWYVLAQNEIGVTEIAGPRHHSRILDYFALAGSPNIQNDETAWCSAFACAVFELSNIRSARTLWALDWLKWGQSLPYPQIGCVVVLTRDGGGHVALFSKFSDDGRHVLLLGGNQSNKVCYMWYPIERVRGYRWPHQNAYVPPEIKWQTETTEASTDDLPNIAQATTTQRSEIPVSRRETYEDVVDRLRDQGSRIVTVGERVKKLLGGLLIGGAGIGSFEMTAGNLTIATAAVVLFVALAAFLYFQIEKIIRARVDDDIRGLHIGRKP